MNGAIAISASSGIFPGVNGPATVEQFWSNVRSARPATLTSLEKKWGIPRSAYFDPKPGVPYRTYFDSAYTIAGNTAGQVEIGQHVLAELLCSAGSKLPAPARRALCLGTAWSDASYFAADSSLVLGDERGAGNSPVYGPDAQVQAIAEAGAIGGPAFAVDNACASSLYAIEAGIGLLESGLADVVAVMGLNAYLPPFLYLGFSKLTALSPTGEILPFSAHASGIVPAEAVAAILMEPLGQALSAGRRPLAIISGIGLSADGGERSVFAPGPQGQGRAYERAYRRVDPASVAYVEAHGTATVLGDQTEIEALDEFFSPAMSGRRLPIGSVKALVGHSLASAGMVSVVKTLCMLRDGVIPPHPRMQPNTRLEQSCLRLPEYLEPWPEAAGTGRVGISSFGFGGANAHLVLEAWKGAGATTVAAPARHFAPVAICAMEATAGGAHGLAAVARRISEAHAETSFPYERFFSPLDASSQPRREGSYFPAQLAAESDGLRMGPKALARIDPFQRLGTHVMQRVWEQRHPATEPEETAVVFCNNLGGETGLQLLRHYLAHFGGKTFATRYSQLELSLEAIASGLPSLSSGFASYLLGLKAFHATVSGPSETFLQTILLSPYWLRERCSTLILAAGRHLKSPLDLQGPEHYPGEAAVAFLLQEEEEARRRSLAPVAVIRAMETGDEEGNETVGTSALALCEVCQLDPGHSPEPPAGTAQHSLGYLGEASGAEGLLRLLLTPGTGWRTLEFRHGTKRLCRLLIEKLREPSLQEAPLRQPLAIEFQPQPAAPNLSALRTEGTAQTADLDPFVAWQQSTERSLTSYFEAQRQLLSLLDPEGLSASTMEGPKQLRPLRSLRRDERNIVLESALLDTGEGGTTGASALLKVDETHSYFFDHPLDHVPGILLLEGILQTVELLLPEQAYVHSVDLSFRKWCEKQLPVRIVAHPALHASGTYAVQLLQNSVDVARAEVQSALLPVLDQATPQVAGAHARENLPDPKYLHKLEASNVLVTGLEMLPDSQLCSCGLLPPASGHVLNEGGTHYYSLLYLLETARQFVMLVAHQVEKIPLDMAMNLISIRLHLEQPVPRGEALRFVCARQPVQHLGQMTMATISMELLSAKGKIGECAIKAQVVDKETYRKQRGFAAGNERRAR